MKQRKMQQVLAVAAMVAGLAVVPGTAWALKEHSASELAKAAQNPVANLISLPLQMNMNFDTGPQDDLQVILNVQPVYPVPRRSE